MVTERVIINALILGAAVIVAPFIISSTLTVDFVPAAIFGLVLSFLLAFFVLKDTLCLCPLLGCSMALSLNFLPLPLDASHVACIMLILYYVTGYVIIRQKSMKVGKPGFLWPILTLLAILLYHNHDLAMRGLGGEGATQGAKPAYLLYLVFIAYFCSINIKSPSVDLFSKLPLYSVYAALISSIPFLISTVVPAVSPYLHLITNRLNMAAYAEANSNSTGEADAGIGRLAIFGYLSLPVQGYLLCRYPMGTWMRPNRWWIIAVTLFCAMLAVATGFRNVLFAYGVGLMLANLCYYSWRSIFLPIGAGAALAVLITASSNKIIPLPLNKLPMTAQRSMSFLPGDWDPEAIQSADASNDFRRNIKDVYIKEYLTRSPLFGIGFNIDSKTFDSLSDGLLKGYWGKDSAYIQAKAFIEGQQYHTGWISLYDTVGIVGSIAFLALAASEIWMVSGFIFGPKADRRSSLFPLYVWMFINLTSMMIGFFTVFGDFGQTLTNLVIDAMVLSHVSDLRETREAPTIPSERKGPTEFSRSGEARYGYQTRY
jgi:hypothetical protein